MGDKTRNIKKETLKHHSSNNEHKNRKETTENFEEHLIELAETLGEVEELPEWEGELEVKITGKSMKTPRGKSKKEIILYLKEKLPDKYRYHISTKKEPLVNKKKK